MKKNILKIELKDIWKNNLFTYSTPLFSNKKKYKNSFLANTIIG